MNNAIRKCLAGLASPIRGEVAPRPGVAKAEEGSALLEFVLCFPFVLVVFICSIDLGRALNTYFTVTRIVYEGTRFAGQVGALETRKCIDKTDATPYAGHMQVRARVDALLWRYNIDPQSLPPGYLATERYTTSIGRDQVRIQLRIPFDPIFPFFQVIVDQTLGILGTDATGPYLFL